MKLTFRKKASWLHNEDDILESRKLKETSVGVKDLERIGERNSRRKTH